MIIFQRIRRGTVWRRYVRFPGAGRPWEYGPRSPRLVFRDLEPAPGLAPSWSHNQLLPEDQPQGKISKNKVHLSILEQKS